MIDTSGVRCPVEILVEFPCSAGTFELSSNRVIEL